jgi:hypothetical protein
VTARDGEAVDLSVVIVNCNMQDLLGQCLALIRSNRPHVSYEIWVVDNASTDGSGQMVREQLPWVQLIENQDNPGFPQPTTTRSTRVRGDIPRCSNLTPGCDRGRWGHWWISWTPIRGRGRAGRGCSTATAAYSHRASRC